MLVSTIIPVFNRPLLVREAVESVVRQSHEPIEVILVDDGSTDETPDVIQALLRRYPDVIRTARIENSGPGVAREIGRNMAGGDFVQYLDSDDLILPDKFAMQIDALRRDPDAGIAYGKTHHSGLGGDLDDVPFKRTGEAIPYLFPALLESRWWSTSTPLYRRGVTDEIGPWEALWNEEDWEYEARAAALGSKLVYCDAFVSVTRWHDDRLHHGGGSDPLKLRDRARARQLIYQHAKHAGVSLDRPEMRRFARGLFLLSRQCGKAGLTQDSRRLFEAACEASGPERADRIDFRVYRLGASLLGWKNMGRLSHSIDSLKRSFRAS